MAGKVSSLFTPTKLGAHQLQHRVALAPLTRMRGEQYEPTSSIIADYYAQRSSCGGLIITEGTHVSPQAGGQDVVPGIWNRKQAKYWKMVTDAIRAKGAISSCQLWHRGRCPAKKEWQYENKTYLPIGPSPIPEKEGRSPPKEMTVADIDAAIDEFENAAKMAVEEAGFDMVEIHNANGYLGDEFLQSNSNKRTDDYGGSIQKRYKFTLRLLEHVTKAIGQERVGIRFSPYSDFQGMGEEEPLKTFVHLVEQVLKRFPKLAYIHLVEARINGGGDRNHFSPSESLDTFRQMIENHNKRVGSNVVLIVAGVPIEHAIEHAKRYPNEILAFGRYFISNPGTFSPNCHREAMNETLTRFLNFKDLPERLFHGWPLNKYDRSTFYTAGAKGYTDYPAFQQARSNL